MNPDKLIGDLYDYWQSIIDSIETLEGEETWISRVIDEAVNKSPNPISNVSINLTHQNQSGKS